MRIILSKKGIVSTVGATIVLGTFGASSSSAAFLDFDFTTINGATGSFTLDTSIQDSNGNADLGFFENAITNIQYPLFGINEPGPLDIETFFNPPATEEVVIFSVQSPNNSSSLGFLDIYLDYDDPDILSNNPDDYFISEAGDFAGYGGLIQEFAPPGRFSRIVELSVTKQSIPEPSFTLGLLALSALGTKKAIKRTFNQP
ncbi:MAG: hypothetical protein QNJ60_15055 [Xenococcaceae cyanobacterium MO_188.B19]|nr:hypothetical protein [Xenococcaceae cyanobacterium MO_188.B19]